MAADLKQDKTHADYTNLHVSYSTIVENQRQANALAPSSPKIPRAAGEALGCWLAYRAWL